MNITYGFEEEKYREHESLASQLGPSWKKRIFEIILTNVCLSVEKDGLKGAQARSYNRVLEALDAAKDNTLTVDKADAEFLRAIFLSDKARVAPLQVRIFCLVQDGIEKAFRDEA